MWPLAYLHKKHTCAGGLLSLKSNHGMRWCWPGGWHARVPSRQLVSSAATGCSSLLLLLSCRQTSPMKADVLLLSAGQSAAKKQHYVVLPLT